MSDVDHRHIVADEDNGAPQRQLSLFDTTSIIVGIIIGSGLYRTSPLIASSVESTAWLLSVWIVGGVLALMGALCYAELATAYPVEGGDFVFLSRAYGRRLGFVYAWCQLWVIRPGSIGAIALVFAAYLHQLLPTVQLPTALLAVAAVVTMAIVNMLGVRQGKWTQNVLSAAKVVGLLAIIVLGLTAPSPEASPQVASNDNLPLALILVLFTYSGWNEMPNVAAEVRDPRRNILRALVLGASAVTAIYVLTTLAFVHALGLDGVRSSSAVAADTVSCTVGPWGARAVSVLVCLSALGAMNGMTMTGSRVYYAFGRQHPMFAWLGRWSPRFGTPVASLATEAAITSVTILVLAAVYGADRDIFGQLVTFTAPLFWLFLAMATSSLFVLRRSDPSRERPFRVPLYPVTPALFALVCGWMTWSALLYAWGNRSWEALWAIIALCVGIVLALFERRGE